MSKFKILVSCDFNRSQLFGLTSFGSFQFLTLACKHISGPQEFRDSVIAKKNRGF